MTMDNEYYTITVHGVKLNIEGRLAWSKDKAIEIAKQFLNYGFHLIEIRHNASQKIEVLWTVRDKE